uniref:Uncharacterized protein n=1 Tax=Mustela putorius furo TaxID=9669 RepID=M3YIM2_MUSPF
MDAGWRTRKRQTAKLRADERREDTRAAAGLGGGEGRGRTPANPGPPGGGDQSRYRYVSQRRRSEALGPSVALAAVKGAESEDPGGDFGSGTRGCLGAEAAASEGAVCPERGSLRGAGQELCQERCTRVHWTHTVRLKFSEETIPLQVLWDQIKSN